jgi:hypothetical protein
MSYQTMIESDSQLLLYKIVILLFLKELFQTLILLFYASKTTLLEYNDLFKIIFCSENMLLIGLEGYLEDLENLETRLN